MKTYETLFGLERDGEEELLVIRGNVYPPVPGVTHLAPEDCVPPEPGHVEITFIFHPPNPDSRYSAGDISAALLDVWDGELTEEEREIAEQGLIDKYEEDDDSYGEEVEAEDSYNED